MVLVLEKNRWDLGAYGRFWLPRRLSKQDRRSICLDWGDHLLCDPVLQEETTLEMIADLSHLLCEVRNSPR